MRWLKGSASGFLFKLDGWLSKSVMVYILALPILLLSLLPEDAPLMRMNGGWPYLIYLFFLLYGFLIVSDDRLQDRIRQLRWVSLSVGMALAVGFSILYNQLANPDAISPGLVLAGMMRYFGGWICILAFFRLACST